MDSEPPERDVKDFEFRQLCKFRLFPSPKYEISPKRLQLLAASSKYGLLFAANNDDIKVVLFSRLSELDEPLAEKARSTLVMDAPAQAEFKVAAPVVQLAVSNDDLSLAVVLENGAVTLQVYDIRSFADLSKPPVPFVSCQLAISGVMLADMAWNPAYPNLLSICMSDGSVTLLDVKDSLQVMSSLPPDVGGTCLSWSPRGKQVMVGKMDGSCTQYDHELKEKKHWPPPTGLDHQLTDILWVSTYSFLGSYLPVSQGLTAQPIVVLTVSSKDGPSQYICFDDVCFGSGEDRKAKYFFSYLPQWEMTVMSSSNATETTIIAKHLDDKTNWHHWNLEDSCRAELPVTDNSQDSFPVGMCVALCSQQLLQLGDNKTHPPCPTLLLLSTEGLLVLYHMAYFHSQAAPLTAPPQPLTTQGARQAVPGQPSVLPSSKRSAVAPHPANSGLSGLLSAPSSAPSFGGAPSFPTPMAPTTGGGGDMFGKPPAPTSGGGSLFSQANPAAAQSGFSFAPISDVPNTTASATPSFSFGNAGGEQAATPAGFPFTPKAQPAAATAGKPGLFGTGFSMGGNQNQAPPEVGSTPSSQPQTIGGADATASEVPKFSFAPKPGTFSTEERPGAFSTEESASADKAPGFSFAPSQPKAGVGGSMGGGEGAPKQFGVFTPLAGKAAPEPGNPPPAYKAPAGFGPYAGTPASGQYGFSFRPTPGAGSLAPPPAMPQPASSGRAQAAGLAPQANSGSTQAGGNFPGQTANLTPNKTGGAPLPPGASFTGPASVGRMPAPSPAPPGVDATSANRTGAAAGGGPDNDIDDILDSTISQNITEEIEDFEKELRSLKARMSRPGPVVGTKEEMQTLLQGTMKLAGFCQDITTTTKDQSLEVQDLKGSCLDLFAMAEECRVRMQRNRDPHYLRVLQQRTLDPATAQRMRRLRQGSQAIDQGLNDVDAVLDSQWEDHMAKEKKTRIRVPSSDVLYRTIRSNHNVLLSQHNALERVQEQLKKLQLRNCATPWDNSSAQTPPRPGISPSGGSERPRDWRLKKAEMLTPEKISLLRDSLANHTVRRVRCQPLASQSMSRLVRSERRESPGMTSTTMQAGSNGMEDLMMSGLVPEERPLPFPVLTSTPATLQQAVEERPPNRPTSFSGMAYFRKPQEDERAAAPVPLKDPSPTPPMQVPAPFNMSGKQPTSFGFVGLGATSFRPTAFHQSAPAPSANGFSANNVQVPQFITLQDPNGARYEDLTPTEGYEDDTEYGCEENEEDDDEDDDEDEDDENETGFGEQYEFSATVGQENDQPEGTPLSSFQTQKEKPSGTGVSKTLFNTSATEAKDPKATVGANPSLFTATAGSPGFTFGASSTSSSGASSAFSGSSTLLGKPLFGMAGGNSKETEKKVPAAAAPFGGGSLGSAFGAAQQPPSSGAQAGGFGLFASKPDVATPPKSASANTAASNATKPTSGGGFFGTSTTPPPTTTAGFPAPSAAATTASGVKEGGLFGFSTVPSTASTTVGAGLLGAGAKLGGVSGASEGSPKQERPSEGVLPTTTIITPTPSSGTPPSAPAPPSKPAATTTAATAFGAASTPATAAAALDPKTSTTTATPTPLAPGAVFGSGTSLFGSSVPSFGSIAKPEGSAPSAFTSAVSTATPVAAAGAALFGKIASTAATTTTSGTSLFGKPASTTVTTTAATTATAGTLFGKPAAAAPEGSGDGSMDDFAEKLKEGLADAPSESAFGGTSTTSGSLFGSSGGFKSSGGSLFGAPSSAVASTTGATGSLFGSSASSTAPSLFSMPSSTIPSSGGGLFGMSTAASGSATTFGSSASPGSIFGSSSPATGGSVFGGATTATTTSGGTFGFGQGGGFGGFGKPAFGSTTAFGSGTQSSPGFGQTGDSGFGQPGSTGFSSGGLGFGQQATATSDSTTSSTSSGGFGFGGGLFGLGAKPSEEKAKQNVFGTAQTFGTSSASSSLFGSKGATGFGGSPQTSGSGAFGGSGFSNTSTGGVATMGFSVTQPAQSGTGFGGAPAFGGSPAFGGAPAFGSTPSFGGSPAFGSAASQTAVGAGFGSSAAFSSPFGATQPATASPGFGSFASANTPTFGNLAHSDAPSFGSLGQGGGGGGFGSVPGQGGGFGSQSPGFGGGQQPSGFGSPPTFGSSPSFSAYRG